MINNVSNYAKLKTKTFQFSFFHDIEDGSEKKNSKVHQTDKVKNFESLMGALTHFKLLFKNL